jgi:hypothetical protein
MWCPGRGCYDGGTAASGEDCGKLKMEFLNPLTWDWIAFLKIAFGAGIGTAAVQGTLALWRDARVKKDHAAYLALRVAVLLESYASESCDFIFENASAHHGPDEQYPEWNALLPTLPNYPDDPEGWRAMNRTLVARCLNLPNKIHGSQGVIRSVVEYQTGDDLINALDEHAAARGVEAWEIAAALRVEYGLEAAEMIFDYAAVLNNSLKIAIAERVERERRMDEMPKFVPAPS